MSTLGRRLMAGTAVSVVVVAATGCRGGDQAIRLYTSVTGDTVTAVVERFEAESGLDVVVFRAPTGELAARIAAEQREGGIRADVLWLTDPLSMQQYAADGVLQAWQPEGAPDIAPQYRADSFWGTRLLSMIIVQGRGVAPIESWADLADPAYRDRIVAPDPGFAGSAFAVFGYFASEPSLGFEFYRRLRANGLTIVNSPGEVVTAVAEGRFDAGITLLFSAREAREEGSPIAIVWPEPGAITLYSPIGLAAGAGTDARRFVEYVLSEEGQQRIADSGWQPILPAIPWEVGGPQVAVDWSELFDRRAAILDIFRAVFGE